MTSTPLIDRRYSVRRAAIKRNIASVILLPVFIILGVVIAYDTPIFPKSDTPGWAATLGFLLGWLFILGGVINILVEVRFAIRSRGQIGEWHIFLDNAVFRWTVPDHAHGQETAFDVKIEDIERADSYRIDEINRDSIDWQFWLKLKGQDAFQLRDYSGVRLDDVLDKLADVGVPCFEVSIRKNRDGVETQREVTAL